MKNIKQTFFLLFIISAFYSCEKKINIDLEEKDKQIAIESMLKEGTNTFNVKISRTSGYFANVSPSNINNAVITLKDQFGLLVTIPSVGNGLYETIITAVANRIYTLTLVVDGTSYIATSYLNTPINLQTLSTDFIEKTTFEDAHYVVKFNFKDPINIDNYYRIQHYRESVFQDEATDLIVFSDDNADGNDYSIVLNDNTFQSGENIMIELVHIDKKAYHFYYSLIEIVTGGAGAGIAAPGNPESNWSNGALGTFVAYSSDALSIVIP